MRFSQPPFEGRLRLLKATKPKKVGTNLFYPIKSGGPSLARAAPKAPLPLPRFFAATGQ